MREGEKMNKFSELVKKSQFTPRQLAIKAGVTTQTVYDWMNGKKTNPTLDTAFKLADTLGVDINEFRKEE